MIKTLSMNPHLRSSRSPLLLVGKRERFNKYNTFHVYSPSDSQKNKEKTSTSPIALAQPNMSTPLQKEPVITKSPLAGPFMQKDMEEQFKHPILRSSPRHTVRMTQLARGMSETSLNFPLLQMQGAHTTPNSSIRDHFSKLTQGV